MLMKWWGNNLKNHLKLCEFNIKEQFRFQSKTVFMPVPKIMKLSETEFLI